MNDNGQGRRWVAPTQGEAPVFEWMETGELRATTQEETGAPSLATVRERGAGGWSKYTQKSGMNGVKMQKCKTALYLAHKLKKNIKIVRKIVISITK